MSTEKALLRGVIDSPEDDLPRLAYADWLDENGKGERADFIRLQVRLAQIPQYERAWQEAYRGRRLMHGDEILQTLPPLPGGVKWAMPNFRRGFPEGVRVDSIAAFLENAEEIFPLAPILHLEIDARHESLDTAIVPLADSPWLGRLRSLEISLGRMAPTAARRLGESPHAQGLHRLALTFGGIGSAGVRALVDTPLFPRLRELDLQSGDYADLAGPAFAAALWQLHEPCTLQMLNLCSNRMGPGNIGNLAACPALANLTSLDVSQCSDGREFRHAGMYALAASPHLAGLRELRLGQTEPTARGVRELVNSTTMTNLRSLDLHSNHLGPQAGMMLAGAENLKGLVCLRLDHNKIGDKAAAAIALSPHLTGLAVLELMRANLGDKAGKAFLESPNLADVVHLSLYDNAFSPAIKAALKERFGDRVNL
jgi:uncharacterized protein (TIGR02996 family)